MEIEETDSFIIMKNVDPEFLINVELVPFQLLYWEGCASDGLFSGKFVPTNEVTTQELIDAGKNWIQESEADEKMLFTLYFVK